VLRYSHKRDVRNLRRCRDLAAVPARGSSGAAVHFLTPTRSQRGLNFTLTSALGDTDLLGEIVGGGSYDQFAQTTDGFCTAVATVTVVGAVLCAE
jgi:hypothetical protein